MDKILLDNAYEAWSKAYFYHHKILSGFFSLGNKKGLVASLQNAVELYLKQVMLDENDHAVAWIQKVNTEHKAELQLNYLRANDLNSFFSSCSADDVNEFYSIEFNNLINGRYKHLLLEVDETEKEEYKEALKLLKELRNAETHFYIDEVRYLTEKEFIILWRFMAVFYNLIEKKGYLPFEVIHASQGEFRASDYRFRITTDFRCNESFTYKSILEQNKYYKIILERLSKIRCFTGDARMSDIDNLSWEVWRFGKGSKFSLAGFEEIEDYRLILSIMINYEMIRIIISNRRENYDEFSDEWEFSADYTIEIIN